MSHAVRLGQALNRVSSLFAARTVGAPALQQIGRHGADLRDRGRREEPRRRPLPYVRAGLHGHQYDVFNDLNFPPACSLHVGPLRS